MKTLKIKGFTVNTNIDEQPAFKRSCYIDNIDLDTDECIDSIHRELIACEIVDFIESVAINKVSASSYSSKKRRGYTDKRLEPFSYQATKKKLTLNYTGSQGGGGWYADIMLK